MFHFTMLSEFIENKENHENHEILGYLKIQHFICLQSIAFATEELQVYFVHKISDRKNDRIRVFSSIYIFF